MQAVGKLGSNHRPAEYAPADTRAELRFENVSCGTAGVIQALGKTQVYGIVCGRPCEVSEQRIERYRGHAQDHKITAHDRFADGSRRRLTLRGHPPDGEVRAPCEQRVHSVAHLAVAHQQYARCGFYHFLLRRRQP